MKVYDSIAVHWNHTRGRRKVYWHRVKQFIEELPPGTLLADIGDCKYIDISSCDAILTYHVLYPLLVGSGDGKYLTVDTSTREAPVKEEQLKEVAGSIRNQGIITVGCDRSLKLLEV